MKTVIITLAFLSCFCSHAGATSPTPSGVLSLTPVEQASYIAVRSTLPGSIPIGGVSWYNNDGGTVFPSVMLAACSDDGSPDLSVTAQLGADVGGNHLGWSELTLTKPVLNDVGDLFVVIQLPPYEAVSESGSGPGIGYAIEENAPQAFLSTDGQTWTAVGSSVALMLEALPASAKSGATGLLFGRPNTPVLRTELLEPRPNPFNPATELRFTLAKAGEVELAIYNLRGRRVTSILEERLDPGEHTATWNGRDDSDAHVASGVYLARLKTVTGLFQKRMVLLK